MTEEERAVTGRLFSPAHPELTAIKRKAHNLCIQYNQLLEGDPQREEIIKKLLGKIGARFCFNGPIWFNYGCHTTIGEQFFANNHLHISDDAPVTIGDRVMFGPNVTLVTPGHPLIAAERRSFTDECGRTFAPCFAKPIMIGNDVWLGASVTVCGGISIGDGAVIGAGSVVTKDIPANVVAVGSPCRILREITERDSIQYMLP